MRFYLYQFLISFSAILFITRLSASRVQPWMLLGVSRLYSLATTGQGNSNQQQRRHAQPQAQYQRSPQTAINQFDNNAGIHKIGKFTKSLSEPDLNLVDIDNNFLAGGTPLIAGDEEWNRLNQVEMLKDEKPADHVQLCNSIPGLLKSQMQLCKSNRMIYWRIADAARIAIDECQEQFQYERWNCTLTSDKRVFGKSLRPSSKEAAFVNAISGAAIVHSIVRSCSSGNLSFCTCDTRRQGRTTDEGWRWGGCSDDLRAGEEFARKFIDAPQLLLGQQGKRMDLKTAVELHNSAAGRAAIKLQMQNQCRCHGVSGSCETKTCWKQMPSFRQVGDFLKKRYDSSVRVPKKFRKRSGKRRKLDLRKRVKPHDIVYLRRSPNYCVQNRKRGILGTHGRECRKDSNGPDSCSLLCCGRGYNIHIEETVHRCECKFVWCCDVRCKSCVTKKEIYTCK